MGNNWVFEPKKNGERDLIIQARKISGIYGLISNQGLDKEEAFYYCEIWVNFNC
jgi:hypothetical protein